MKIVRVQDIIGTEREVTGPGWTSRRMLLKKDGMGFSFHETIIPAGAELNLWYKHHLEAVYCVAGNGTILDKATGETHEISDGTLYALDKVIAGDKLEDVVSALMTEDQARRLAAMEDS